jgi:recombination protein RecA
MATTTEKVADKNSEKLKALRLTIDKIDKDYGKGSVMMMNERSQEPQAVISTVLLGLMLRWESEDFRRGELLKFTGRNLQVKPHSPFM